MPSFATTLVLLSLLISAGNTHPVEAWLQAPSTSLVEANYSDAQKTLAFEVNFTEEFAGELAIVSATGETLYQSHHHFARGPRTIHLEIPSSAVQQSLIIFHDFGERSLKTMKISLP